MTQPYHICGAELMGDYTLAAHIAGCHSDDAKHVTVIAVELSLPVVECDVDAIYLSAIVAEKAALVNA